MLPRFGTVESMSVKNPAMMERGVPLRSGMTAPETVSAGLPGYALYGESNVMFPFVLT